MKEFMDKNQGNKNQHHDKMDRNQSQDKNRQNPNQHKEINQNKQQHNPKSGR